MACVTIIVETASRFARDLMVQEVGFAKLQGLGVKLVAADSPRFRGRGLKKSHSIRTTKRLIAIIRRSCSDSSVIASQMETARHLRPAS
jgi:hypothetical protein